MLPLPAIEELVGHIASIFAGLMVIGGAVGALLAFIRKILGRGTKTHAESKLVMGTDVTTEKKYLAMLEKDSKQLDAITKERDTARARLQVALLRLSEHDIKHDDI